MAEIQTTQIFTSDSMQWREFLEFFFFFSFICQDLAKNYVPALFYPGGDTWSVHSIGMSAEVTWIIQGQMS